MSELLHHLICFFFNRGLPPVGSFSHSHIIELDGNSSIESETSLTVSLSPAGFPPSCPLMTNMSAPGKPNGLDSSGSIKGESSKKSKLKSLIDKVKYDQGQFLPSYIDDNSLGSKL